MTLISRFLRVSTFMCAVAAVGTMGGAAYAGLLKIDPYPQEEVASVNEVAAVIELGEAPIPELARREVLPVGVLLSAPPPPSDNELLSPFVSKTVELIPVIEETEVSAEAVELIPVVEETEIVAVKEVVTQEVSIPVPVQEIVQEEEVLVIIDAPEEELVIIDVSDAVVGRDEVSEVIETVSVPMVEEKVASDMVAQEAVIQEAMAQEESVIEVDVIAEIEVAEVAVIEAVPVDVVANDDRAVTEKVWRAVRGADAQETLRFWSKDSQVDFIWMSGWALPVHDTLEVSGSYEEAVQALLDQYADYQSRVVGTLYIDPETQKRTLVVEADTL